MHWSSTVAFVNARGGTVVKEAVTFIVRAVNEKTQVFGCLNSIYRQNNKAYEVVVVTNIEGFSEELKEKYDGIRVEEVNAKKDYVKASNKLIKKLKTRYFVYTNSDTVYTPNTVDEILASKEEAVIFNISRLVKNSFVPVYPRDEEFTFECYVQTGVHIWNNAISTEFVVKNDLFISKLDYFDQLMYLINIYSLVDGIRMIPMVLSYRAKVVTPKKISYSKFCQNRKALKKILRRFSTKGMNSVVKKLVADFVFDNINVYYEEKNFLRKLWIKHRIRKYICI